MYTVYKHTAPNGKVYIGITGQKPEKRWKNGNGYRNNPHFYHAVRKYTWKNIEHEIMKDGLTKEQACDLEIELIAKYDATNPRKGYNISTGGEYSSLGVHPSAETRRKMSESHKRVYRDPEARRKMSESVKCAYRDPEVRRKISESVKRAYLNNPEIRRELSEANKGANNPHYGKRHSLEARRKISEAHKGKPSPWRGKHLSAETRKKLSEAHKGKQLSPETRRKIGESLKGRHLSPEARKKLIELNKKAVICVETGTLYSSVTEAAESIGVVGSAISQVVRGARKTSGGYHWKYAD